MRVRTVFIIVGASTFWAGLGLLGHSQTQPLCEAERGESFMSAKSLMREGE